MLSEFVPKIETFRDFLTKPAKWFVLPFVFMGAIPALCQSNTGELRLQITDPSGRGVLAQVEVASDVNQYRHSFVTDREGNLDVSWLPSGIYQLDIRAPAFAPVSEAVQIRSALPLVRGVQLRLAPVTQSTIVHAFDTLINPDRAGSVNEMGRLTIENRLTGLPGRSIQDLVISEPGWLYEGNAVLHPRGAEYQTQFVLDGIPLTDNRSPGFAPAIEADEVESMTIYTAGIPAEFGRKMGGVVEINTAASQDPGLHGRLSLFGGTYATGGADAQGQYTWKANTLGFSASGDMTDHYLNPVVPQNYTNSGTIGSFSSRYERQFTPKDRATLIARHELAHYDIPNELVQQNGAYLPTASNSIGCPPVSVQDEPSDCTFIPGGQLQTAGNSETLGSISYRHIFSPKAVGVLRGMVRHNSSDFSSNPSSWPLVASQHNHFNEIYFNGSVSVQRGRHEWKAGLESDTTLLNEHFSYLMSDCANRSDPRCPINLGVLDAGATNFTFAATRPDLEQSAYVEDGLELGNWSINAGLRWDHYQLLVNQNALSPRIAASHYFSSAGFSIHGAYDRVFQTPSFENILLSSSSAAEALDTSVPAVQLPVEPSHGNYYELGATKAFFRNLRLDTNVFRRDVNHYADDSQVLSTGISFPIAFRKAVIYGAEAKLELQHWKRFSGFGSYSYMVGNAWYPVTGGLFLGNDAASATTQLTGHFPDSQDQRNTVRNRIRYQVAPRLWFAVGSDYDSGLPFQPDLTTQQYAAEYGEILIRHLNFQRNRIHPYFTQNASLSADLFRRENHSIRLQADAQNLGNTLELMDFGGLFSGNAIGPSRQYTVRLITKF